MPKFIPILLAIATASSLIADVLVDFYPGSNVRPNNNPYPLTISNLGAGTPSVSTSDSSNDVPALIGSFADGDGGDGSFVVILDGRSDDSTAWDGDTWSGGTSFLVKGNNSGLGIADSAGVQRLNNGEAILWSFDLSNLTLDADEFLVITAAEFEGRADAQFWQLTGTPGNPGAGTLVNTGGSWSGQIIISDGDTFGHAINGRLQSITLDIVVIGDADTPTNLTATPGVSAVSLDWDNDTSGNLENYSIYRSISSPVTTDDALLGTTVNSNFTDDTAVNGVTYYYAVTATGTSKVETALSNEVSATPAAPQPIQLLEPSNLSAGVVSTWPDQSGNNNDATTDVGSVVFPSMSLSKSGLEGVDFGPMRNSLKLFDASPSDAWLDLSSSNDGFCVILSFKCDGLVPGQFNDLLGNSTDGATGLQLGYTDSGHIQVILGGTPIAASADHLVEAGDTVIIAFNYNAATGDYELWESKNFESQTGNRAKVDFSTANPVTLGSINDTDQFFNGMVGEVRIYDISLNAEIFKEARESVLHKWVSPPNILMILGDDMAWYDTPVRMDDRMANSAVDIMRDLQIDGMDYKWNFERLAENGMTFRNAYSGAPQCTPTRACLQTGQTTARTRVHVFLGSNSDSEFDTRSAWQNLPVVPNGTQLPLPSSVQTIPEVLSPMGYQCAHYGKWHLSTDPEVEGYIESDGNNNNSPGATYSNSDPTIPEDIEDPKRITEITDKTIAFMNLQRASGKPFYIQLSHFAAHGSYECTRESRALFQNHPDVVAYNGNETDPNLINRLQDPAVFYGMIYELDRSFARLFQELETLGIADNTYIIFKSDNGMRHFDTQHFRQPFFARKWFVWQGGIRVPMMVTGPGIPAGTISTANVVTYDLLPTFYEWAGGDPSDLSDIDGISLKGLLEGQEPTEAFLNRSIYFHYPHYRSSLPFSAIVKGNYKLMHSWDATIRTDISVANPNMLFDLSVDPGEFHNLNTSPGNNAMAASLWADLDSYLTSVSAWRPMDNTADYLADGGANLASQGDHVTDYAHFEGSRIETVSLNDADKSPADYWFELWGVDIGGDDDDFEPDGLTNLMEYSLGTSPIAATNFADNLPVLEASGDDWVFGFSKRYAPGEVTYSVEMTDDLNMPWTSAGITITESQLGDDFNWATTTIPFSGDAGFVRLRVTRP